MNRFLVLLIICILLAGCAASSVSSDYNLDAQESKGLVVVSVTHDNRGYPTNRAQVFFTFDGDSLKDYVLVVSTNDKTFEGLYGKLYVLEFPAGRHELSFWSAKNGSGADFYPRDTLKPLEFEVQPGSVTYTGNLHGNLVTGRNFLGITIVGDVIPEIRNQAERDIKLLLQTYPQFEGKIKIKPLPLGRWTSE